MDLANSVAMMNSEIFIGRQQELTELNILLNKKTASLVVIKSRRRIGKSRLIDEFAKNHRHYKFVGLTPDKNITAQMQRDEFSLTLSRLTSFPEIEVNDWGKLFSLLARETSQGRVVIIFDKISWMGSEDPTFLAKLKTAWDEESKKNPDLIMFLCSSVSTWMEDNILNSTGFYERIAWNKTLQPLPLADCNILLEKLGFKGSIYEKLKILSITGAVPWYIEQIQCTRTAEDNIKRLCFTSGGILVKEFDRIFKEIFNTRSTLYKKIIHTLVAGDSDYKTLVTKTGYQSSGRFTEYLKDLINAGFVSRDYTWQLKSGKISRFDQYRLSDNYMRFYLKYIQNKQKMIEQNRFNDMSISSLRGWGAIMGLQFENLIFNNREAIIRLLNLRPEDIIADNPFFQTTTTQQKGCQIDYLIQTNYNNLYVCEIKFSRNPITSKVINDVKEKIQRLSKPRNTAVLPVLIHVNGITEQVLDANYFYKIIDFGTLLAE